MTEPLPLPLRVLLVEDNSDDAELIEIALSEGGLVIEARVVANEPDLRAALADFGPELALVDWNVPGFSGAAAVTSMREWDPAIPVILVSGAVGEQLVIHALRVKATDYVSKQNLAALAPTVRRALEEVEERRARSRLEAELASTRASMETSLDAMLDPFLICAAVRDEFGTITGFEAVFANRAAQAFMGRMPDLMTGAPTDHGPPLLGGRPFFDAFLQVAETGDAWVADGIEFTFPRRGGSRREGVVNIQVAPSGDGFFATWQDVTALHEAQAQLERRRALRRAVNAVGRELSRLTDPASVALAACRAIVETGEVAMAWVGLIDPASGQFVPLGGHGDTGYLEAVQIRADESPLGHGPAGEAVRTMAPVVVDEIAASPLMTPWRDAADRHGYRSVAAFPLRYGDAVRGVFVVYGGRPAAFGPDEAGVLGQLAADVALALSTIEEAEQRREARAALEVSEARLRTTLDTMLEGVVVVTAIRDGDGRIVDFLFEYCNVAIGTMSQGSSKAGHTLLERLPAHRTNGLFDAYVQVVETGVRFEPGPFHYVDPDAAGGPLDQVVEHSVAKIGDGYVLSVRDVTERDEAEREMRRLSTAIEQSSDAVMITDTSGAIQYINPAFERVSGYTAAEALGQNPRLLKSGVQGPAFYAAMWATLTSGHSFVGDMTNRRKDGTLYEEEAVISPIVDINGTITSYVAVKRDVTRERTSEAARKRLARERAQIGETLADLDVLPSPAATATEIARHVVRLAGITTARLAYFTPVDPAIPLAFVRADGVPGSLARVPLASGRKLRERAGQGPWVEAWVGHPSHPYDRLFRELGIVAAAHAPIRHRGELVGLLSVSSSEANALEQLTETLPALLQFAGVAGVLLGPAIVDLTTSSEVWVRIASVIGEAAFRPVFQPIVDIPSGHRVGFEALTRFSSGIRPDLVFENARAAGLEAELEIATLAASIKAAAGLPAGAWLSLNVSPGLVTRNGDLARLLHQADRPVVLEVTEHVSVADYAALRAAIGLLQPEVRVAVDDAGSGVANFNHIVELRPSFVKLDIGLVRGIDADLTRQALMVGLLHFARSSASQTIAEGVETELELATLRVLGVPLAQGYLLGRPAPVEAWAEQSAVGVTDTTPNRAAAQRRTGAVARVAATAKRVTNAAVRVDASADRRASTGTRDQDAHLRNEVAGVRADVADARDKIADRRDDVAAGRDRIADGRDRVAGVRKTAADARDTIADARDAAGRTSTARHDAERVTGAPEVRPAGDPARRPRRPRTTRSGQHRPSAGDQPDGKA